MHVAIPNYWSLPVDELLGQLKSSRSGLSSADATSRLQLRSDSFRWTPSLSRTRVLWRQLRSPLLLLLVFASVMSLIAGEWSDAGIVLAIVLATVGIGYSREYRAQRDLAALAERTRTRVSVLRDGAARHSAA